MLLAPISHRRANDLTSGERTFSEPGFSNQGKLIYEKYKNSLPSNRYDVLEAVWALET